MEQAKQNEVFLELIYYIFDSLIIPLIRFNFHVTESSTHQNRLFYFRHDVWRMVTEPAIRELKSNLFQEIPTADALKVLDARSLGFSQVRLLPKATGLRPIMNLKRRVQRVQNGRTILGKSINSILKPSLSVLKYEKERRPNILGASLFSVNDMHPRLKRFRAQLESAGLFDRPLCFVKVDVKACFDTIPQAGIMRVINAVFKADEYQICHHTETKGYDDAYDSLNSARSDTRKAFKRFHTSAHGAHMYCDFEQAVRETLSVAKNNVAFTDAIARTYEDKDSMMTLLRDHVENNLIKHGKRFYRQKTGISQGSVLSTMLCNYFYADMERRVLASVLKGHCILLRLIDDFLFISVDEDPCIEFLSIMLSGVKEYGAEVHPSKSLTNFAIEIDSVAVPVHRGKTFPYCGVLVDTQSLEITKDWERRRKTSKYPSIVMVDYAKVSPDLIDTLSVEQSRMPGRTFNSKMLRFDSIHGRRRKMLTMLQCHENTDAQDVS